MSDIPKRFIFKMEIRHPGTLISICNEGKCKAGDFGCGNTISSIESLAWLYGWTSET